MADVRVTIVDSEIVKVTPAADRLTFVGNTGPAGPAGGTYDHSQGVPAASWVITHNLGFKPNVLVIDSAGSVVHGDISHDSANQTTLTFSAAFAGHAYLS